jgi:hypothetical protein
LIDKKLNSIIQCVLKTGPDRPVEPVQPGTGAKPVWSDYWIGHANEPMETGMNRLKPEKTGEPAIF